MSEHTRELYILVDPRTAEGAALDRWARIVGLADREPGETDEQLRARIEGEDEDTASPFYGLVNKPAPSSIRHESTGIPRSMLSGTVRAWLDGVACPPVHEAQREPPPGVSSLAIGTRVRVDDRSTLHNGEEGVVVNVDGAGGILVRLDSDTEIYFDHRASLALVDDTLPECPACYGAGLIPLFTSVADCPACGGSGVVP